MSGSLRGAAAALLLAGLAGCAGVVPAPLPPEAGPSAPRYDALRAGREARVPGTLEDLSLWLETPAGRYPGVRATCGLGGADTLRLRVASSFGTALDAAAAGDSLVLWVPSRRTVVRADAAAPPLGLPGAAAFGVRIAAATWRVPASAWRNARSEDTLTVVRWSDADDTLEVAVGGSGLPRRVRFARPGMPGLRVTYLDYGWNEGAPWPERYDVEDGAGRVRLSVRVRRVSRAAAGGPGRWSPEVPADAEALPAEDLWRWIEEEWSP